MSQAQNHYRITVTPIADDGLPCSGRCSIEFDCRRKDDWTRMLEANQRLSGVVGDERAALIVALGLLNDLMQRHEDDPNDIFAALRPPLSAFIRDLQQRDGH